MSKLPKKSAAKQNLVIGLVVLVVLAGAYLYTHRNVRNSTEQGYTYNQNQQNSATTNNSNQNSGSKNLPAKFQLTVPFTAQAPTANWDELHNQACEEASAIMTNAFFAGISSLPPATVEKEIDSLTKWQQDNFGYNLSINTQETVQMIQANFPLNAEIVNVSEQTIKQALVENKLVIFPGNGQMLNNPNFKTPGPVYHMLVITGYNGDTFVTNDPGTRNGFNYKYSYSTLEAANGNWDKYQEKVNLSDKKIIIVSKK
ncbi:MAG TPA: hypothetical protein VHQ41_03980 [Patescibacteria group bacterium]|jgi:hypothetical protein|nr:hypothetical protein [Patescibacteria group bacterium]